MRLVPRLLCLDRNDKLWLAKQKDTCANVVAVFFPQALEEMNGKELEGEPIEIVFAKPPDQKRKERKAQRQAAKTQM